jgi:hypothetical protein
LNTLPLQRATLHIARIVGIGSLDCLTLRPDASAQGLATNALQRTGDGRVARGSGVELADPFLLLVQEHRKPTQHRMLRLFGLQAKSRVVPFRFHSTVQYLCGADRSAPADGRNATPTDSGTAQRVDDFTRDPSL